MQTSALSSVKLSGTRRSGPSNVIPFLAARPRGGSSPLALAAALRRLHQAELRGGFVLVAPVSPAPAAGIPAKDATWWSQLCDRIREQTRMRVALIDVPTGTGIASAVARGTLRRAIVIDDIAPGERAALIELSRGICTSDPQLLAEAQAMGVPAPGPDQLSASARNGTLSDLVAHPITETLPASA